MKRFGACLTLVLGFTCFTGSAPAQSTPDKRTIVDRLVPEKIKTLAENATFVLDG